METVSPARSLDPEAADPTYGFWTKEELELFSRAKEHEEFSRHPVWSKLKTYMDSLVDDAQAEMRANKSPKPEDAFYLQTYWREREHVRDLIVGMVYAPMRDRDAIIDDLKSQQKQKSEEASIYAGRS